MTWASFGVTPPSISVAQPGDVDAVGLELDHPHGGAVRAQVQQRAVVRRLLDDDDVTVGDDASRRGTRRPAWSRS